VSVQSDQFDDALEDADAAVEALVGIRSAAERIADTLDDYMEMSLAAQGIAHQMTGLDPEVQSVLQPLVDVLEEIRARRYARKR
jgi:hypothetical protein